jgi:CRP/FNR family transcriptional regulator, cyclic AMP receptor protein
MGSRPALLLFKSRSTFFGFPSRRESFSLRPMSDRLIRPELPPVGIVAEMDAQDRALLGNYGEFLPAQPGQTLITAGEDQEHLYLVISGLLHVTIMVEGRVKLIARVEAGETLGEVNVFDPGKASATVIAQEFSQIWKANRDDIDLFVKAYPEPGSILLSGIITVMCRRIRNMNKMQADNETMEILAKFS